ncbi:MAG TPA: glycosyltransferase family 39 protein [Anaeromyxobacteraceae bacterium]|nr:glycosyltransferase family 39 protein [Anaeromyxobacteraceae bacterium]
MTSTSPESPPAPSAPTLLARFAPAAALVTAFAAMLIFSWGKWPDVLIDFGHELYIPWQLSLGKVLNRDVMLAATGPLSPYLNALAFLVAGTSLRTLVVLNLAVLAGITWLLYVLLRETSDRFSATLAGLFFLTVLAFGQYLGIGNFNYVTPYSHGATHGMLLSLAAIAFLWRHARTGALRDLAASSTALGLVFLTKPELFVACAAALGIAGLLLLRDAPDGRTRVRWALALSLPALGPPLVALALLSLQAGPAVAWRATFGPWLGLGTRLPRSPFYMNGLGFDHPASNLGQAAVWLTGYGLLFGAAALLDRLARGPRARWIAAALAAAALAAAAWTWIPEAAWFDAARPLPAVAAAFSVASLVAAWRAQGPCQPAALARVAVSVFALLLLLKMVLNARLYQYGFVLAMPATVLLVAWLGGAAPRLLRRGGGSGVVFRAVAVTVLVYVAAVHLQVDDRYFAQKTVTVGAGADAFLADGRGEFVNAILGGLSQAAPPGATLAVIPEGVMINFLSRRANPTPYVASLPDALAVYGEGALLDRYQADPPQSVVIVSRNASEHGATTFGVDYGVLTLRWLDERYEISATMGGSPFDPDAYGMMLLSRRGGAAVGQAPAASPVPAVPR